MKYIIILFIAALLCGCEDVPGTYQREMLDTMKFFKRHGICFAVISHRRMSEGGLAVVPNRLCDENPEPPIENNIKETQ